MSLSEAGDLFLPETVGEVLGLITSGVPTRIRDTQFQGENWDRFVRNHGRNLDDPLDRDHPLTFRDNFGMFLVNLVCQNLMSELFMCRVVVNIAGQNEIREATQAELDENHKAVLYLLSFVQIELRIPISDNNGMPHVRAHPYR